MKNWLASLLIGSACFGWSEPIRDYLDDSERNHRFFVKPDLSWGQLTVGSQTTDAFHYGLCGGYEYIAPQSVCAIGQARVASSDLNGSNYNLEGALGYNVLNDSESWVIPFVGVGRWEFGTQAKEQTYFYAQGGLKMNATVTRDFSLGFETKGFRFLREKITTQEQKKKRTAKRNLLNESSWGLEASLPISWHQGDFFDVQFEPYYLALLTQERRTSLGTRFRVGFYF